MLWEVLNQTHPLTSFSNSHASQGITTFLIKQVKNETISQYRFSLSLSDKIKPSVRKFGPTQFLVGHKDGMLAEGFRFCAYQVTPGKMPGLKWEGQGVFSKKGGDHEIVSPPGRKQHDLNCTCTGERKMGRGWERQGTSLPERHFAPFVLSVVIPITSADVSAPIKAMCIIKSSAQPNAPASLVHLHLGTAERQEFVLSQPAGRHKGATPGSDVASWEISRRGETGNHIPDIFPPFGSVLSHPGGKNSRTHVCWLLPLTREGEKGPRAAPARSSRPQTPHPFPKKKERLSDTSSAPSYRFSSNLCMRSCSSRCFLISGNCFS